MPEKITVDFFLSTRETPVIPQNPIWNRPLPLNRRHREMEATTPDETAVTYGDYFTAVSTFLKKDRCRALNAALALKGNVAVDLKGVPAVAVFLVKHGAFYHPARITVKFGGAESSLVVNVAVSKSGRDHIKEEFFLLERLHPVFEQPVVPRVYYLDEIPTGSDKKLPMFIGQWFEGFCEFHISPGHPENRSNLIVWEQGGTNFFLTLKQAEDVYRQAAFILTCGYGFFTFEQISAWHHAAGDFILKPIDSSRVDLRLITVRKYAPLVENTEPDPAMLIETLLLFLINLTIRNRVDRLDGTGALAWADDFALKGTISGFFNGLHLIVDKEGLPETLPAEFRNYILAHSKKALFDLFSAVVDGIPVISPEHVFIKKRLEKHVDLFSSFLSAGNRINPGDTDTT